MPNQKWSRRIIFFESAGIGFMVVFLWLDEILDLPNLLFGAPPTPVNVTESMLESGAVVMLGTGVIYATRKLLVQIDRLICDLKRQALELDRLNEDKDKFFSIISHDLRSPFVSILGFGDLLSSEATTLSREDIRQYADKMSQSARKVYQLLENLLNWARIKTGRLEPSFGSISVKGLLRDVRDILEMQAARKRIDIVLSMEEDALRVRGDESMLNSVVRNLVSNAVKFTSCGGRVELSARARDKENVVVEIRDNGVGMAADKLENLFRIASRHASTGTAGEKGSGLGLILCRELVSKNRGSLEAESRPGTGTVFRLRLPRDRDGESPDAVTGEG
jgi:signal transduction histidine kinase